MREKSRLKIFACLLAIVGSFADGEARTIHVAVPTLSMVVIAFTAAKEKGYYRDEGLDVDLVVMRDTLGISALIGGNVDFASMSGAGLTAILGGVPLRFAFSSFYRPMFWIYAKPEIQDIKALKGKKIGVTGLGSGPDNLLRETLKRNGIEGGRDAVILALGLPSTVATALRTGTVDAGTISPPFNFAVKDAGFRELVSFLKEDFVELQGSILVHERLFAIRSRFGRKICSGHRERVALCARKQSRHDSDFTPLHENQRRSRRTILRSGAPNHDQRRHGERQTCRKNTSTRRSKSWRPKSPRPRRRFLTIP